MANQKTQTVLAYLQEAYSSQTINYSKSPAITDSYDFAIDTGTATIILNFKRSFWERFSAEGIISYLKRQHAFLRQAISENKNITFPIS